MSDLFSPFSLRGVTLKNRIGVSPMCMYSCRDDGVPTDWHMQHLASRSVGGAGLVITEASAVVPEGRITPADVGLWNDTQMGAHARIVAAVEATGSVAGIQIAHAGRKASRAEPWVHGPAKPSWTTMAPSAEAFEGFAVPHAMTEAEIGAAIDAFVAGAKRSVKAGYRFIEIHGAHGYLAHQFMSPISNRRNDSWGGDFEGRTRFVREVCAAVRAAVPADTALALRISHTDWVDGGWNTEEAVELARRVKALGIDLLDVSSGGLDAGQKIPLGPGYQVPGAAAVKAGADMPVAAVGLITEPKHAQEILSEGKADLILLARVLLREPYWPMRAAAELGQATALHIPPQYERGWNTIAPWQMDHAIAEPMQAL